MKKWLIIGGLVLAALAGAYVVGRCSDDAFNPEQPPEIVQKKDVKEGFHDPEIRFVDRIRWRDADVLAVGTDSTAGRADVDSFVSAAQDTLTGRSPIYLPSDFRFNEDDRLSFGATRSDGSYHRQDFDCPRPCVGGTRDSTMFAHTERAIPRLLPQIVKKAAICAAVGGAAYGTALAVEAADEKWMPIDPALVGVGGGAACAITVTF